MQKRVQNKQIPEAVQNALIALDSLRTQNAALAEKVHPLLSGYALQLQRGKQDFSTERLLEDAKRGPLFIKQQRDAALKERPRKKTYEEVVAKLKARDKKTRYKNKKLEDQMRDAAEIGDIAHIKRCLRQGVDINIMKGTAIRTAAAYGQYKTVKFLYRCGANIITGDDWPLLNAVNNGHLKVVKFLHRHGANIHAYDNSLFYRAVAGLHLDVAQYLYENGVGLNSEDLELAFAHAAFTNNLKMLKYFYSKGANIHFDGDTSIILAGQEGHLDAVKYLKKLGLDINAKDARSIVTACFQNRVEVMEYLRQQGISLHKTYADGHLLYIAAHACQPAAFDYLRRNSVLIKELNKDQQKEVRKFMKKRRAWKKITGQDMIPWNADLNPKFFNKECYDTVYKILEKENPWDDDPPYKRIAWLNYTSYMISGFFGSEQNVLQYLERWGKGSQRPLFDITEHIKIPGEEDFNLDNWRNAVTKCGPGMARLIQYADKIPSPYKNTNGKGWSLSKTRDEASKYHYDAAEQYPDLAKFCMQYQVKKKDFGKAVTLVENTPSVKKRLPDLTIDGKKFGMPTAVFKQLPAGDFRGLFLGQITDNCQHIGSDNGGVCAEYGYVSKDAGFYVLEKDGKIIGDTYAWRGTKGELVFDSLEALKGEMDTKKWTKVLHAVADELTRQRKCGVSRLVIGAGGETPDGLTQAFKQCARLVRMRNHHKRYGDSDQQLLVWKRGR